VFVTGEMTSLEQEEKELLLLVDIKPCQLLLPAKIFEGFKSSLLCNMVQVIRLLCSCSQKDRSMVLYVRGK
jgi:hypothetical protein